MTENRSLDEFLPADDGEPSEDGPEDDPGRTDGRTGREGRAGGEDDGADEPDADGSVEPAVSTYAWSPGGAACAACGAVVEERWRDDDGLVCADCKAW